MTTWTATDIRPLTTVEEAWASLRRGVWSEDAAIRERDSVTGDERGARAIDRFEGRKVTVAVLCGLERHGWTRWVDAAVRMAEPIDGASTRCSTPSLAGTPAIHCMGW